jgi:hypothetical protein
MLIRRRRYVLPGTNGSVAFSLKPGRYEATVLALLVWAK